MAGSAILDSRKFCASEKSRITVGFFFLTPVFQSSLDLRTCSRTIGSYFISRPIHSEILNV